jgi:hypothetical protein
MTDETADPRPDDVVGPDPVETDNGPRPDDPEQDASQNPDVAYVDEEGDADGVDPAS